MDDEDRDEIEETISASAFVQGNQANDGATSNDLGDHRTLEPTFGCQTTPDLYSFGAQTRPTVVHNIAIDNHFNMASENKNNILNMPKDEAYCNIKYVSINKLSLLYCMFNFILPTFALGCCTQQLPPLHLCTHPTLEVYWNRERLFVKFEPVWNSGIVFT